MKAFMDPETLGFYIENSYTSLLEKVNASNIAVAYIFEPAVIEVINAYWELLLTEKKSEEWLLGGKVERIKKFLKSLPEDRFKVENKEDILLAMEFRKNDLYIPFTTVLSASKAANNNVTTVII